ncbi:MAG: hypothetical protein QOF30_310 [Acidimicrobiaceae bacterium]|nr:hypothetical protein [Acidimicrobiaceae bacterium]
MIRFRKRGLALMGTAVLTMASVGVVPAVNASAQPRALAAAGVPFSRAAFLAYGTGSEVHLSAVSSGASTLAKVEQAFSANTAAGGGLGAAMVSPVTGAVVQSDQTANAANAYGRGSGLEVGLGLSAAQSNQLKLGIAEAHAAPPSGLITKTAIPLNIPGILTTGLLTGKAAAAYNSSFCPVGQPLAYGEGDASAPTSVVGQTPPLVSGTGASGTQAAQSRTRTDLVANADGTFGLQNTVEEIITPLTVNLGAAVQLAVTVQGNGPNSPFTVSTFTDGEGHSSVTFSNNDPVVKIDLKVSGVTTTLANVKLSLLAGIINPLLGTGSALSTTLALLGVHLSINVGVRTTLPGAIAGSTSVAYDLLAINASLGAPIAPPLPALTVADVRLGHVESEVALPNGAIACTVPVAKVANPAVVQAGNTFTWTILIPATSASLNDSTCDLTGIKATDKISVNSGSPTFTINSISNGGTYNASTGTITWANLGTYHPGDPPIAVSIGVSIPAGSAAGVLQDTANVTAGLGNCTGGATGVATAIGSVGSAIIGGSVTLIAPQVTAAGAGLATTGTGPMLPWIAAGLLILAAATHRVLRRVRNNP